MLSDLTMLLPISAALISGLAALVLVLALQTMIGSRTGVQSRLDTYLGGSAADDSDAAYPNPQIAQKLNDAINRQSFATRLAHSLEQANLPLTVPEYLLLRMAVPLLLAIIALVTWRTVLLVPIASFAGLILPSFWVRTRRARRNQDFNDQLAETLTMIVGSLRGGFSLIQSLTNAAKESPEPTRTELRRVAQEVQLGRSLSQALDHLVQRMESDDLDLVVTAIKINARIGGNLTTILETISNTIRERNKLRREIQVITSMQRLSSYVIGLLPLALAGIIFALNPSYMLKLFQPGWTLCIPVGTGFFSLLGFVVIQRIVNIKV